jgi:hypothetical protein
MLVIGGERRLSRGRLRRATLGAAAVGLFVVAANFDYVRAFAVNFVAVAVLAVVFVANRDLYPLTTRLLTTVGVWVVFTVLWVFGTVIKEYRLNAARERQRAALFAADRDARAQEAVSLERARLARELQQWATRSTSSSSAGAAQRVLAKLHRALEAIGDRAGGASGDDRHGAYKASCAARRDADVFNAQPARAARPAAGARGRSARRRK